ADAEAGGRALGKVAPGKVPAATAKVLRRLDAATDAASRPIGQLVPAVRRSSLRLPLTTIPVCRAIGPDSAFLLAVDAEGRAPEREAGAKAMPGVVDVTAPALLRPARYRPPADIAALAAHTTMTGRARTVLYASVPVVE